MDTKYKENYIRLGLKSPSKAAGVSLETLFKMADILEIEPYELLQK